MEVLQPLMDFSMELESEPVLDCTMWAKHCTVRISVPRLLFALEYIKQALVSLCNDMVRVFL